MKFNSFLGALLFLLVVFPNEFNAQTTSTGGLVGVVSDPSQAVVTNADIQIKDVAKGTVQSTKTDREGVYRFFFLPPGRYTLTVSHDGFREEHRGVNVLLGPPGTVNVALAVARELMTVRVTGEAPLLNAENGDASTTINQQQISEVPNPGNDITYIAQTTPGAIMNTEGGFGNFSILGMPGTSNLFTVNGMYDNDSFFNGNLLDAVNMTLGQNQIQEATVVTNGYSGQFGGFAGANVNYLTKSGGNKFHGNAVYYWNGDALNANSWINNALGTPRPFSSANQWAASFGGPIEKDKWFFFLDTEGLRIFLPTTAQVVLPSPQFEAATIANIDSDPRLTSASHDFYKQMFDLYNATPGAGAATPGNFNLNDPTGCTGFVDPKDPSGPGHGNVPCAVHFQKTIGQPTYTSLVSGRVDWNIGSNDRAFLQLQYEHGIWAYADAISPLFNVWSSLPTAQGQLNETHIFDPTAANQLLLAAWYARGNNSVADPSKTFSAFPTTLFFPSNGFSGLGGANAIFPTPSYGSLTQYQVADDFVKIRGEHKLGFGAIFVHASFINALYNLNAVGTLAPQSLYAFYFGGVDPSSPATDFTSLSQSFPAETSERFPNYSLGLYAQDEWRLHRGLTLTVALRADHPSNPVCTGRCFAKLTGPFGSINHDPAQPYNQALILNQKQAFQNTDALRWAPRFGFAWQPLGVAHNLVLRGGIGIFYDPFPIVITVNLSSNPPLINSFNVSCKVLANGTRACYNLSPNETNSLFTTAKTSNAAFVNGFTTGQTLAQIQNADPFFLPPGVAAVDNKMHSPQYQKWNLELQQAFGANTSLSIGYSGNHGIHELVQNLSANAWGFGSFPANLCSSPPIPPCADPRFGQVTEYTTPAISNYNGMVVSFEQRFKRWGEGLFQVNYTYGHALDEVSNGGITSFTPGSSIVAQDPNNLRGAYGPADYDVRHSLRANYVWEIPVKAMLQRHGSAYLVKGWQISGTVSTRSALPYTAIDWGQSGNLAGNNFAGPIYAVPVSPLGSQGACGKGAAIPAPTHTCLPPQFFVQPDGSQIPNADALFVQSGCETGFNTGNLGSLGLFGSCPGASVAFAQGRNRFRGPHYFNTDFTILKNTKIPGWENAALGIGFQFFNVLNHPNFRLPDTNSSDGGFGQIFSMAQPPTTILGSNLGGDASARMIQLKVQLQF